MTQHDYNKVFTPVSKYQKFGKLFHVEIAMILWLTLISGFIGAVAIFT